MKFHEVRVIAEIAELSKNKIPPSAPHPYRVTNLETCERRLDAAFHSTAMLSRSQLPPSPFDIRFALYQFDALHLT